VVLRDTSPLAGSSSVVSTGNTKTVKVHGGVKVRPGQSSRQRGLARSVLVVLLASFLTGGLPASANGFGDSDDDSLQDDAQWVAKDLGISVSEALERFQLQKFAGGLEESLAKDLEESFGGLWIENEPVYRVVVSLTHGGYSSVAGYVVGTPLDGVVTTVGAKYTISQLQTWAEELLTLARSEPESPRFDLAIDRSDNEVLVIADTEQDKARVSTLASTNASLQASAFSFVVGRLAEPSAYNIYGGLAISTRTTGFTVRKQSSGNVGVATAGHCSPGPDPGEQYYNGHYLPMMAEDHSGSQDVQWHDTPGGTNRPWVYDGIAGGSTPYYRTITGTLGRAGQPEGATTCSYGKTTGYRCGFIVRKDYAPSYIDNANATFIWVHNANNADIANPGDSGGPWFNGSTAWGIHSGHKDDLDALYMAINYISSLDLAVVTT